MLADASESACRSLRDASPNKIEALVRHISEDKLKDGQFDESGLTLQELRTIENSIINSILATRHNRISYPETNSKKSPDSNELNKN
jgi:membrane-associated HD superfamily phosphohydrolase